MKKVYQRGDYDCFPACIASITERELSEIPFIHPSNNDWFSKTAFALAKIDIGICKLRRWEHRDALYICVLNYYYHHTDSYVGHAVVVKNGEIIHDPYPHRMNHMRTLVSSYYIEVRRLR